MSASRPILVTGSHRSGTTWTGKMIARSPQVAYIHEPFNLTYYHPGICSARFDISFRYVTSDNESDYYPHFLRTACLKYNWIEDLQRVRSLQDLRRALSDGLSFQRHRLAGHRPLFKDPLAVLSAEWLADRFDMQVVVLIRHPAAFVSSIKRFDWKAPVHQLLGQPLLMRDELEPYRQEMQSLVDGEYDLVTWAAEFWKLVYYVVDQYRERHPEWCFVRHEDLSREPVEGFRKIFDFLDLDLTKEVESTIEEFTSPENPSGAKGPTSIFRLDSRANIWNWKTRLTPAEIERVRTTTIGIASRFYSDDEW